MTTRPTTQAGVETAPRAAVGARVRFLDIAGTFFLIGLTGFGGGMAIVGLMHQVCVRRKRWLADEEFSHGIALGQFVGAFAVNTATFIGHRLRGVPGAVTAVVTFLTPGVALLIALSGLYARYHASSVAQDVLAGIAPVVVAILLAAAWQLARPWRREREAWALAALAFGLSAALSVPVLAIIAGSIVYGLGRYLALGRREQSE